MKVFGLTTGADTAGINVAIASAFRRHAPDWDVRSMVATVNYIEYPVDVRWNQYELERLYDESDVVMLHNTLHAHRWYDAGQGKPTVLMHHGLKNGSERPFAQMVRDAASIGAVQVCSTLDLAIREPKVAWLPPPVDLQAMRNIRRQFYKMGRKIRIGHAPTNRAIKGSDAFDAAMKNLRDIAEPVVIENKPWRECLRLKATCDVFYDQPALGYGSNAIEAWAMGIPVIAAVAEQAIHDGMLERWGVMPFYEATEKNLEQKLRDMAEDRGLREAYSKRGAVHVELWHDERQTVAALKPIFASAKATVPGGSEKRIPFVKSPNITRWGKPWLPPKYRVHG